MGQQQLLLIVLGVIIVGVAIVAGIGLFNAGAEESVKDEIVAQSLAIASNAQQWFKKPVAMGGGGQSFTTSGGALANYVIPPKMAATSNAGVIDAATGEATTDGYTLTTQDPELLVITGTPNTALGYTWHVECTVTPVNITSAIVGATP